MINVLIADHQGLIRNVIKCLLTENPQFNVVAEAGSGSEIFEKLLHSEIDLILLEPNVSSGNGTEIIRQIRIQNPTVKILILTIHDNIKTLTMAFNAGANGYLLKTINTEELFYAINKVNKGGSHICFEMAQMLMLSHPMSTDDTPLIAAKAASLSRRELEVLQLIGEGLTSSEIADKTRSSRRTVETHRKNLADKTKSKNTAMLIRYALKNNII